MLLENLPVRCKTDSDKEAFVAFILKEWKRAPELRFGQLIYNALTNDFTNGSSLVGPSRYEQEIFYRQIEDKKLIEKIQELNDYLAMKIALE